MVIFNTAWKHVRRSPYQALAAIFILIQTFFVISLFTFVIFGSARVISYFESQPRVSAFFKEEITREDALVLEEEVNATGKIAESKYVSKEEALQIYQNIFKDDPLLLEFVTSDILPASLEVSTYEIEDLASISEILRKSPFVQEITYPQDIVSSLTKWTSAIRKVGAVLIGVLALDSVFIMVIIIGIKISQKREEIEIMKLLSATNWYIRWPFMYEGIFYGITGAFFGWVFATGVLLYATPFLKSFFGIPVIPISPLFLFGLLGAEVLVAIILGVFSSFLAVLRYLK
ncbi:MAG TPA: permease-like cell division protein FtsX [Patescibacteria group bacterium]|nr:permease-like cell division protein FtsX [Patescibacteria group bacterium]